ncbi:MAG: sce7726 family protein [Pseudomonadota bacterium]
MAEALRINGERRVRAALKTRHLRHYDGRRDVLMIDELGLAHARSRIDLAVFNGHLHGYEIKSANDTLNRLPPQLATYVDALQKLTLVVATRHLDAAAAIAPNWCGLTEIVEGPRGGMMFASRRRARVNPDLDPFMLAHLLWHPEAQNLLRARGASKADVNAPRKRLYRMLADEVPVRELAPAIKAAMASRTRWRDHLQPS